MKPEKVIKMEKRMIGEGSRRGGRHNAVRDVGMAGGGGAVKRQREMIEARSESL